MATTKSEKKVHSISIGSGLYTAELSSAIPDGYLAEAKNFIASGQSLENRSGIRPTTVTYSKQALFFDIFERLYEIESPSLNQTAFAWANLNTLYFIASSVPSDVDPFIEVNLPDLDPAGKVRGFARYNNVVYFTFGVSNNPVSLYKITAFNWTTDSITYALVTTFPSSSHGLFFFKDRMWSFYAEKLFYSELVTTTNPLPETWPALNYVSFNAPIGYHPVWQIIPLGNKLIVFSKKGIYSLLVEGPPSSWIKRTLDSKAGIFTGQAAFEANGLIYYATNTGVYVTNGSYSTKISSTIEDAFTTNTTDVRPSLHYLNDGMLLTFHRMVKDSAGTGLVYDITEWKAYYSKLDPVAWTEWSIHDTDPATDVFAGQDIAEIHSIITGIPTGLSTTPLTVMLLSTTRSTNLTVDVPAVQQLCVYDGGKDRLQIRDAAGVVSTVEQPIVINFITRFTDADSILNLKRSFEAYIEIFSSAGTFDFITKFEIDGYETYVAELVTGEVPVGSGINLVRITADFRFRRVAAHFIGAVEGDTTQIKISSIHMILEDTRLEFERVR